MRTRRSSSHHPHTLDPNVIERAATFISVAALLDPAPLRRPAPMAPRADARKPAP